ncbi:MAG: TetR/AcrR family transcriptional regulator [Solirubrobacteraceae bacterium]|nr:TetR/AcrR family transcriptional regulator [Solirubrobacteraceae bacterium]
MDASAVGLSPAQRTREALLEAGETLAASGGLAAMSISRVTAQAGVAKGTFYLHFGGRDAFIRALHTRFYDRIDAAVAAAQADAEPGEPRLWASIEAYLDACLRDLSVKALLLEARTDGVLAEVAAARHVGFAAAAEPELQQLGVDYPGASARLLVSMVAEVALGELEAGRRDPDGRGALRAFVRGVAPPS